MNTQTEDPNFRKFEELMTPYLQGKLEADEVRALEDYADASSEFRDMLQFEKQVFGGIRAEGGAANAPSFAALRERVKQEKTNPLQRFLESLSGGMRSVLAPALLASAAAALLVVQFLSDPANDVVETGFETLSNGQQVERLSDRRYYRLALNEQGAAVALEDMGRELGFQVESGPDGIGSYEISLPQGDAPDAATLSVWKSDPRVLLLEPIPSDTQVP